ncbi:MAG: hypothetical protein PCFJNLEI_02609 [Verrucomicrobiae bacterium]|nr:hypothetical protein [Verrucomicrobiae bacterium]
MTLLHEIQSLLEHTYGVTGVNFEEFLLDTRRHDELAEMSGTAAGQISNLGRTFLRVANGKLRLGIYYQPSVIEALEVENPQCGLTDNNILPFMVFLEELDHAVHASLKYLEGHRDIYSEAFVRGLELQAKVDSYLILQMYCAFFNTDKKVHAADKRWLKACLFDSERFNYDEPELVERYRESNRLGRRYVKHLDSLTPKRRTSEIRKFRKLDYREKVRRIAAL